MSASSSSSSPTQPTDHDPSDESVVEEFRLDGVSVQIVEREGHKGNIYDTVRLTVHSGESPRSIEVDADEASDLADALRAAVAILRYRDGRDSVVTLCRTLNEFRHQLNLVG